MKRSVFSKVFWFHEFKKWVLTIDLRHWGVGVKFGKYWVVRFLCFEASDY